MTDQEIPAVNTEIKAKSRIVSSDKKVTKDGRKVPARVIREASYKGNIGIMELIKFKTNASPEQKKAFDLLMKKKSEAKSEQQEKQMASQIWDLVQTVTGVRLQQMENKLISFKSILESSDDHILHSLAQRDINASIKDGKVVIYDKADHKKAQGVVKRLGVPHQVVVQKNEETELDEGGPFNYGAKTPKKGSVAYEAMLRRQKQERQSKPIEPKDQMVGDAKIKTEEFELNESVAIGDLVRLKSPKNGMHYGHVTGFHIDKGGITPQGHVYGSVKKIKITPKQSPYHKSDYAHGVDHAIEHHEYEKVDDRQREIHNYVAHGEKAPHAAAPVSTRSPAFQAKLDKAKKAREKVAKLKEAHKPELHESVKVGDSVHVGMSQKGGAGVRGVVTKIDGDWVHVRSHDKEKSAFTGKEIHKSYKGQLKHTTKD